MTAPTAMPLVEAKGLTRVFDVSKPWLNRVIEGEPKALLRAVTGISFTIGRRETLALVGESGSGKSTAARMVVGLLRPTAGTVTIDGVDMWATARAAERQKLRRRLQMIFQDPYASLNPRWRVDRIIADPIKAFGLAKDSAEIEHRVGELLKLVGLDPADGVKYPHEFSGGQRQRICIARALSSNPEFIVCDEPTSALDELAPSAELFTSPRHPYTRLLMDALPDLGMTGRPRRPIEGEIPNPISPPPGCAFHPRCPWAYEPCAAELPELVDLGGRMAACHAVAAGRI
jgi:peptide/nickel transport system ATP-binding protein